MTLYEQYALAELTKWQHKMKQPPGVFSVVSMRLQARINQAIPEKIHNAISIAIKNMIRTVFFGAEFTTGEPLRGIPLDQVEQQVNDKIRVFRNSAAAEGAITGAGGFLLGLADFPLWLTIKMKMLFEIASLYGYNTGDLKERIFMLHIFELTFSNALNRQHIFTRIENWQKYASTLPNDIHQFDWRKFQQEYRDYIDIAKLLQLIPGIGAPVGAYVNHRLTQKLGITAMQAFRMRWLAEQKKAGPSFESPALS